MKLRCLFAAIFVLLTLPRAALSNPYDSEQVPAVAQWIIHFDIDALRNTPLGEEIGKVKVINPAVNFVVRRIDTLHSILLFGNQFSSDNAVLLISGEFNPEKNQIEIELKEEKAYGQYYSPKLLILSHDKQENTAAVRVLDRKAPALSKDSPLAAPGLPNSILLCSAIKPKSIPVFQTEPWLPLISNLNDASFSISFINNQFQVRTNLTASSEDVATNVNIAFKGLQAILKLKSLDAEPPVAKIVINLFTNAQISSANKKIVVDMAVPLKDLVSAYTKAIPPTQP